MTGTGGGTGTDAIDAQLLAKLPNEVEALGRTHLGHRAFCHQLTPFE